MSKTSLLVSYRQITEHCDSSILLEIASHLSLEFIPLTFQFKIFQDLFIAETRRHTTGTTTEQEFLKWSKDSN